MQVIGERFGRQIGAGGLPGWDACLSAGNQISETMYR